MGDMADYNLDQMWDEPFEDEDEPPLREDFNPWANPRRPPKTKVCRNCRTDKLHWEEVDGKWRLCTGGGKVHQCSERPLRHDE